MASNSDSFYHVLTQLQRHPGLIEKRLNLYKNAVTLLFSDRVHVADASFYFPERRLMVNRLTDDFVAKHGELLDYYYQMTDQVRPGYHDVWLTTCHIADQKKYLLELSYE